jgi:hypothetical protein
MDTCLYLLQNELKVNFRGYETHTYINKQNIYTEEQKTFISVKDFITAIFTLR